MEPSERWFVAIVVAIIALFIASLYPAFAHDHSRPELDEWYRTLMMPDNPGVRCCGRGPHRRKVTQIHSQGFVTQIFRIHRRQKMPTFDQHVG